MMSDELENDPVFDAVAKLRTRDINQRRADALRRRCHGVLQTRARQKSSRPLFPTYVRQSVVPAIVVAWCVAYLLAMIHRAAAAYGF